MQSKYHNKNNFRLNRSELAVPASRPEFFLKAAKSNADIIFLDLEDSVTTGEKDKARKNALEAINDINWKNKSLSVRVNSAESNIQEKDLREIVGKYEKNLNLIMIPKVEQPEDVINVEKIVQSLENKKYKLGFEIIIETAKGLMNIKEIVKASKRIESLHFGSADLAASLGVKNMNIGEVNENYGVYGAVEKRNKTFYINDMWHYALFKILLVAKANELRAVDCPFGDFTDIKGFEFSAKSSYTMGFNGKMIIHPTQIDKANEIYMPSDQQIKEAKEIIAASLEANKRGDGALAWKGKLLDVVSIKQAENILNTANISNLGKKI